MTVFLTGDPAALPPIAEVLLEGSFGAIEVTMTADARWFRRTVNAPSGSEYPRSSHMLSTVPKRWFHVKHVRTLCSISRLA